MHYQSIWISSSLYALPIRLTKVLSSIVWILALLIAAGCQQESEALAPSPVAMAVSAASFQNPVIPTNFPDPGILAVDDVYYAYATNGPSGHVQVARSADLVHWHVLPDALPALPAWSDQNGEAIWAPEAIAIGDHYVLYYVAHDKRSNRQCIGVGTSDKPEGPFTDMQNQPLICQKNEGGSIDPSPFRDGEKLYLYWKNDGNCCAKPTYLYVQELSPDGLSLVGVPVRLAQNDQPWEGRVVEAPTMVKHDGSYFLFFSGNAYTGSKYAVGYATCDSPTGPCQDAAENPILSSRMTAKPLVVGPGHQAVVQINNETWIIYHAWEMNGGLRGDRRFVWIDQLDWKDGKPRVRGPTTDPQPAPSVKTH
jgi:beta-xylosidase